MAKKIVRKSDMYKPVRAKCSDWSNYEIIGFFSHKFNKKGKITGKITFIAFTNGFPTNEVMADYYDFELIDIYEKSALDMIEKRLSQVERARDGQPL